MDLQKQKEQNKLLEKKQSVLYFEFLKKQRQRFDFADTSQWIALNKKEEDFLVLCDTFTKWITALKDGDKRRDELTELIQSVWRLQGYCVNLETITQAAVSEYSTTEKRNLQLVSEKRLLELEIQQLKIQHGETVKSLKAEIEYTQKTSQP